VLPNLANFFLNPPKTLIHFTVFSQELS
jgi:hypothetical protein